MAGDYKRPTPAQRAKLIFALRRKAAETDDEKVREKALNYAKVFEILARHARGIQGRSS